MPRVQDAFPYQRNERAVIMRPATITAVAADGLHADLGELRNVPILNTTAIAVGAQVSVALDRDSALVLGVLGVSGGGVGGSPTARLEFAAPVVNAVTSAHASQTKGPVVACTVNATITMLGARLNTAAGRTYRFRVYEYNQAAGTVALVAGPFDVASPGALTNTVITTGAISANIDRGRLYILATTDTSGAALPLWEDTASNRWIAGPHMHCSGNARIANTDPPASGWAFTLSVYSSIVESVAR
jgi:hypothetical protein